MIFSMINKMALQNGYEFQQDCPAESWAEAEIRQLLPDLNFPVDPGLVSEGWERRFMADAERAREAEELYASLGFEVLVETVKPSELSEVCAGCKLVVCRSYVTVYTRKK